MTLPAGHPDKPFWTYADLAAFFGVATIRRKMPAMEREGFPAPLPWSRRERRFRPSAVMAWAQRQGQRSGALPAPRFAVVQR